MRHHCQIGEPSLLRHDVLFATRYRRETGGGMIRPWMSFLDDNVMPGHETLKHRADGMRAVVALFFGRRHHLLDHRARQTFSGQRCDIAAVHADVQSQDMGIPPAGNRQGGREGGLARRGSGQG